MDRKLAAILAADVVGYGRLMGQDESGTLAELKALRSELFDPKMAEHKGRIFKATGDGVLAEFPSVVNAVACAVDIQRAMAGRKPDLPEDRKIQLRIGINLGDVIVEGDDVFGDGVNVAARLEGVAPPGGVAVSGTVRDHLGNRLDLRFEDVGEQILKNIGQPVRIYSLTLGASSLQTASKYETRVTEKPSIAVLPFNNMSPDPEQEYFADGLVEDIITGLAHVPGLFVIARNSSFTYKGKAVDVRQVAKELSVRYVLEGSIRRAANRLRITGQLVDGATATHLWADKFEGAVEDIFDLQDRITQSIVGAIEPSLRRAEIDRARRNRPVRLDAYDLYLQALSHVYANNPTDGKLGVRLLEECLRLDPHYAVAHAYAAWCHEQLYHRAGFHAQDKILALDHARIAIKLGSADSQALSIGAFVHAILTQEYESAISALDRALAMNPNSALAFGFSAMVCSFSERYERAIEHAQKALRLSPFDMLNYHPYAALALTYLLTDRYEQAVTHSTLAIQENPTFIPLHVFLVASELRLGRLDAARAAADRLIEIAPQFTISGFARMRHLCQSSMEKITESLSTAGLPK
jgi:TolB-like protein